MTFRWVLWIAFMIAGCVPLSEVGRVPSLTAVGHESGIGISAERVAIAVPPPAMPSKRYSQGSLWNSGPASLFGDRRARNLGDILTVVIEIDDQAQISNSSGQSRSGSGTMSIGALMGLPELISGALPEGTSLDPGANFSSTTASSGDGSVSRNEKITLRIAASVVDVLANGH